MRIESGTTTEHRVRLSIFLAMCVVFAAYFAYDGLWGYPAKNLEWARQNIPNIPPDQKEKIRTNPRVMLAEVEKVRSGMTDSEVRGLLGESAAALPHSDGPGGEDHWYVGPAACVRIQFVAGKVRDVTPLENINKSEGDIKWQKIFGVLLGIVSLATGVHYIRIMTMKTVVSDQGLTTKGRQIAWEDMTNLDTSDYDRKGWLDVVYRRDGDTDTVRLDSYHIQRFDEVVNAICERKGFPSPIKPRQADGDAGDDA